MNEKSSQIRVPLRAAISCPHCWHEFSPEETLWVAAHPSLVGDPILADESQQQRFLPTRFDVSGNAIDINGEKCNDVACPECHLAIPRAVFELEPLVVSVVGAPSCGKSYFLASMTWHTRQTMAREFKLSYSDADTVCNRILNAYEEEQFFNPKRDEPVKLDKTAEEGDWYNEINFGDGAKRLPKPFLFAIRPSESHPNARYADRISRILTIYDNAGESFEPGKDTAEKPVTRHLAKSDVLMMLYDPTLDPRFCEDLRSVSQDPQVHDIRKATKQERIFTEVTERIRKHRGMSSNEKYDKPVVVIVTKYDIWAPLINNVQLPPPWVKLGKKEGNALHVGFIEKVSNRVREMLMEYSPELVQSVEAFTEQSIFLPVSATGASPTKSVTAEGTPVIGGICPQDIQPIWVEVPVLYTLAKSNKYVVPATKGFL